MYKHTLKSMLAYADDQLYNRGDLRYDHITVLLWIEYSRAQREPIHLQPLAGVVHWQPKRK